MPAPLRSSVSSMQILWLLKLISQTHATPPSSASPVHEYDESVDNGTLGHYPSWTFVTEDDISAPRTNWLQYDPQCDDGMFYFLTPKGWSISQPGPMILDSKGDLIWSKHFANEWGGQAYDLMVQHYQGQEYLTFWTGDDQIRGHGSGTYTMLNSSYEVIHNVDAANDMEADLHEFLLTPDGTALVTVYQKYQYDMTDWRAFDATSDPNDEEPNWIWDCVLQELAVDTREVLFEWRASEHINVNDTYHLVRQAGNHEDPFDWFHLNSIQKDELGNYLVSARYTHSITYIDGKTGEVIWMLGGKKNMFMDLSNSSAIDFAWQHDARFVSPELFAQTYVSPPEQQGFSTKLLSLFDNAAEDQNYVYGTDRSRGLLLEITFPIPGHEDTANTSGNGSSSRNVSRLRELAKDSDRRTDLVHEQKKLDLPYPNYDHDKLRDPDVNRLKTSQINGSSPMYTVRMIQSYSNPSGVRSSSQGSMQILPPTSAGSDARVLVGYGLNAVFTEFDANGSALCDAHFAAVTSWERGDVQSYRVFKFPWTGLPKYPPRMVVDAASDHAFVSWNGATEVAEWVLQADSRVDSGNESHWSEISRKQKLGFETSFNLSSLSIAADTPLRILALDAAGDVLDHGITDVEDRRIETSTTSDTDDFIPARFTDIAPNTLLLGGFVSVTVLVTLYEMYRRYLCWTVGRPAMGAIRWRKTSGYRLMGEV